MTRRGRMTAGWKRGLGACLAVLIALFVALVLPGAGGSAVANSPQCGDTVTTDVVLTQDLVCPGDGLFVGTSSSVTLDLNGHSIRGSGVGYGLFVLPSTSAIVIEGGTIRNF